MQVCIICGALLVVGDTDTRSSAHFDGKQHQGYDLIRNTVDEYKVPNYGYCYSLPRHAIQIIRVMTVIEETIVTQETVMMTTTGIEVAVEITEDGTIAETTEEGIEETIEISTEITDDVTTGEMIVETTEEMTEEITEEMTDETTEGMIGETIEEMIEGMIEEMIEEMTDTERRDIATTTETETIIRDQEKEAEKEAEETTAMIEEAGRGMAVEKGEKEAALTTVRGVEAPTKETPKRL